MKKLTLTPYQWQQDCLLAWKDNQYRGIAGVVTGAGKTMLALFAVEQLLAENPSRKLAVKIVVPTLELMKQWRRILKEQFGLTPSDIGCYSSSYKSMSRRSFMIYIVNSARNVLSSHIAEDVADGCDIFLIADECHHYASAENRKIFQFIPEMPPGIRLYTLGLSATPRVHGFETVLAPLLGREVYHYDHQTAIVQNTLSTFVLFQIGLSFFAEEQCRYTDLSDQMGIAMGKLLKKAPYLKELRGTAFFAALQSLADSADQSIAGLAQSYLVQAYQRKELVYLSESRMLCLDSLIRQIGISEKIIIFCERIAQANAACQILEKVCPGRIGCYHSGQSREYRSRIMEDFREGALRILVACHCLDEGIDVPDASVGIVLSGTGMARQRIQRLGRILRRSEGKELAVLYYLYLRESSEEAAYLPEVLPDIPVSFLSYYPSEQIFCHPAYEEACLRYLKKLEEEHVDRGKCLEARQCLLSGILRRDWMLSVETCDRHIRESKTLRSQNYWICMKALHRMMKAS